MTLAQAREARDKAKQLLKDGQDPSHAKRLARLEAEHPGDSFEVVAKEFLEKMRREERSENTMSKVEWLLNFALPTLGPLSVGVMRPIDILAVLRTVEHRGRYETARRLRSIISFRVGPEDVTILADEFQPVFDVLDLLNLPNRSIYLKLMIDGTPSKPFSGNTVTADLYMRLDEETAPTEATHLPTSDRCKPKHPADLD